MYVRRFSLGTYVFNQLKQERKEKKKNMIPAIMSISHHCLRSHSNALVCKQYFSNKQTKNIRKIYGDIACDILRCSTLKQKKTSSSYHNIFS